MTRMVLLALAAVLGTLALFLASYGAALALRGPLRATEKVYVPVREVRHVPGPVRVRRVFVPVVTTVTAPAPRPRQAPRPEPAPRHSKAPKPSARPPPSTPTPTWSAPQ
ncbi:MAG TPA: hypothetical protein VIV12_05450 [Streptosporangiaceae bacterium]